MNKNESTTSRTCGTCGITKSVSSFYKDGTDSYGNPRYRRDCKDCYKSTRIAEQKMKAKSLKGGKK